jgi:hypothetical protein
MRDVSINVIVTRMNDQSNSYLRAQSEYLYIYRMTGVK